MEGGQSGAGEPGQAGAGEAGQAVGVQRLAVRVLHEVPFPPTACGLVVSPDGRHVVFYQPALGNVPSIATVPEGAAQNLPNEGNAGQAAWSPEGDYLAYLSTVAGLLGGLGDRLVRLQGWSPDGSRLALLVSPGADDGWALWLVRVSEAGGEGSARSGAVAPQVWDGEKLREVCWLAPDRLLAVTVDDRLVVLQLAE